MTYGVIAVKGVAVYAANDGWSNILGVGDTEYVERLSFQRQHSPIFISGGFAEKPPDLCSEKSGGVCRC